MSTFVVSARKYRPMRFDEVVGQGHVSQTLKNALQNDHLAHAFLFCGPRGVGKTTCARILAKVLNCQNPTEDYEPCNTCAACQAFNENASFNIVELDAASNNSVEHIRSLIEQVRFQPQQGKYKVFIIDEVHMLSQQAFNAFLKTLEEPPSYAIFILATTEKHKIIPTILSRCQIFDFKRIQVPEIVAHLKKICQEEQIEADEEALHIIAQKADGALRDALSIFDRIVSFSGNKILYEDVISNLNVLDYDYYFRVVDALLIEDVSEILLIIDEIMRLGFDGDLFINGLAEHLRNLLVTKDNKTIELLSASDSLKQRYLDQANLTPAAFIVSALDVANDCDVNYKMARNKRLHVEMAMIKMAYLNRFVKAGTLVATNGEPEKKNTELSEGGSPTPEIVKEEHTASSQPVTPAKEDQTEEAVNTAGAAPHEDELNTAFDENKRSNAQPLSEDPLVVHDQLKSLTDLAAELEAEKVETANMNDQLTNDQLKLAWKKYIDQLDRESVKNVLRNIELMFEDTEIQATVFSSLSENTLRQETELMDFLRKELACSDLTLAIKIDKSKAPPPPKRKEILSPKQIYLKMGETNPLLHDLRKRLDLRPE